MKRETGAWSPYLAGGLSGLLAVASVLVAGKYLGASTTFVRGAGMVEGLFSPEAVATLSYYVKEVPKVDWQFLFVLGIFAGAYLAAKFGGDFKIQAVPDMWQERFGPSRGPRSAAAFLGGVVAMYGARLAGG